MTGLQLTWFWLVGFFVIGYTVLAGFDLGLSMLALPARDARERKAMLAGIGPFWDGNEVWLIGAGALLFAVFPPVYAALFSGFYVLFMLALLGLIIRAVSIEFARATTSPAAQTGWIITAGASAVLSSFLFGVVVGNVLRGIPLSAQGVFTGTQWELLNPFALLVGVLNLAMIVTHGALYLAWKGEGRLAAGARAAAQGAWALYLALVLAVMVMAAVWYPHLTRNFTAAPALWLAPVLVVGIIFAAGIFNLRRRGALAFFSSALGIVLLLGTVALALFPLIVPANNPGLSLTITNSSASQLSLLAMLIITLIGMPGVILYTAWVYLTFGGKISEESGY
ncbi:MAG: cytochrome d ubiquinol oxidase subunit II [Armatimonadota bacterium]